MTSMLTYALEPLSGVLPEVQELWKLHFDETEGYRSSLGFSPDVKQFLAFETSGMFRLFTAREQGRLVGHIGFVVFNSRHTPSRVAGEDFFYFRQEARKGLEAVKFLRYAIAELKAEGVEQVTMTSKLSNDIEPLLRRVGFEMYSKQFHMILR